MSIDLGFGCPKCGVRCVVEVCDDPQVVTYWGDGPPVDVTCGACGADLEVQEFVARSWELVEEAAEDDEAPQLGKSGDR